jgi:hypothetical protein
MDEGMVTHDLIVKVFLQEPFLRLRQHLLLLFLVRVLQLKELFLQLVFLLAF